MEDEQQEVPQNEQSIEEKHKNETPFWIGVCILITAILAGGVWWTQFREQPQEEVAYGKPHSHIDFVVIVQDERIDLSSDKYMSSIEQILHPDLHLHDNNQNVLHIHEEGLTMAQFFDSIGFTLTDECLTLDTGETYYSDETNELLLFVDGELAESPANHVPTNETRLLVYFGDPENPNIENHQASITDEACIYTGTCPERGTPPPEACGLTCEI